MLDPPESAAIVRTGSLQDEIVRPASPLRRVEAVEHSRQCARSAGTPLVPAEQLTATARVELLRR